MAQAVAGLRASFNGSTAALKGSKQQNARQQCRLAVVAQAQQQGEGWGLVCRPERLAHGHALGHDICQRASRAADPLMVRAARGEAIERAPCW